MDSNGDFVRLKVVQDFAGVTPWLLCLKGYPSLFKARCRVYSMLTRMHSSILRPPTIPSCQIIDQKMAFLNFCAGLFSQSVMKGGTGNPLVWMSVCVCPSVASNNGSLKVAGGRRQCQQCVWFAWCFVLGSWSSALDSWFKLNTFFPSPSLGISICIVLAKSHHKDFASKTKAKQLVSKASTIKNAVDSIPEDVPWAATLAIAAICTSFVRTGCVAVGVGRELGGWFLLREGGWSFFPQENKSPHGSERSWDTRENPPMLGARCFCFVLFCFVLFWDHQFDSSFLRVCGCQVSSNKSDDADKARCDT